MTEQTLTGLLDTVWQHILRGTADRHHPARHPTLATIGPDGPEARTLVLRAASRSDGALDLFTDAASPKAAQIIADPRVALHIWLPKAQLQIRARAIATLAPGDPALFARLPPGAQANYSGAIPGAPITGASDRQVGDASRFSLIRCQLSLIDALLLADPHQRAIYRASDDWQGGWVAP